MSRPNNNVLEAHRQALEACLFAPGELNEPWLDPEKVRPLAEWLDCELEFFDAWFSQYSTPKSVIRSIR